MFKDVTNQFAPEDIEKNKVVSALAYLGILFFLPLVAAPESKSGKFHANQSLVILLFSVAGSIVFRILTSMFIAGWMLGIAYFFNLLGTLFKLVCLAYFIAGLVFTLMGKVTELPLISKIKIIKY